MKKKMKNVGNKSKLFFIKRVWHKEKKDTQREWVTRWIKIDLNSEKFTKIERKKDSEHVLEEENFESSNISSRQLIFLCAW